MEQEFNLEEGKNEPLDYNTTPKRKKTTYLPRYPLLGNNVVSPINPPPIFGFTSPVKNDSSNLSPSVDSLSYSSDTNRYDGENHSSDDDDYSSKDKYYRNMRADMMSDVKNAVRNELLYGKYSDLYGGDTTLDDSCIDSFSSKQGADFMKYIPGKNPDDYIRKDSVPCYGCSIP